MTQAWHDFCVFDDSWNPTDVIECIQHLGVTAADVVLDPFVGCGTTALVAQSLGCSVVASDLSPLAVCVAEMKTDSTLIWDTDRIWSFFRAVSWQEYAASLQSGIEHAGVPIDLRREILLIFVSTTLRTGWRPMSMLDEAVFHRELQKVLEWLACIVEVRSPSVAECFLRCADVAHVTIPAHLTSRLCVMLTSPPFYGSSTNPTRRLFDTVLKLRYGSQGTEPVSNGDASAYHRLHSLASYPGLLRHADAMRYVNLLEQTAVCARTTQCRAIACEMGRAVIDGQLVMFEQVLAEFLAWNGFRVTDIVERSGTTEYVSIVYAQREA